MFGDEARTSDFGVFWYQGFDHFDRESTNDVLQHVAEVRERKKLVESHIAAVDARRCRKGTKISGDFEAFCFGAGAGAVRVLFSPLLIYTCLLPLGGGVGWGHGLGQ